VKSNFLWCVGFFCLQVILGAASITSILVRDKKGVEVLRYEKSHALLIGAWEYTSGYSKLRGVKTELDKLEKSLKKHGFEVEKLLNPDHISLRRGISNFVNEKGLHPSNRLFFFFAGHGENLKPSYGGDPVGYIVPVDAPLPSMNRTQFKKRAYSMQLFNNVARSIESIHALFIFDCCFSGSVLFGINRAQAPQAISWKMKKPVRQFITAGESADTVPDRSIFGDVLIDGLRGGADRFEDGYITGTELGEYLQTQVTMLTNGYQVPQYGKLRDRILGAGDFVFPLRLDDGRHKPKAKLKPQNSDGIFITLETKPPWVYAHDESGNYFGNTSDSGVLDLARQKGTILNLVLSKPGFESMRSALRFSKNHIKRFKLLAEKDKTPQLFKNKLGMEFVLITPREFQLGSSEQDKGRQTDEGPEHRVRITQRFYFGKYEVTQGEWLEVMENNPSHNSRCGLDCPIENISWKDAQNFIYRLNKLEGCKPSNSEKRIRSQGIGALTSGCYRLPTEAEWEFSASTSKQASQMPTIVTGSADHLAWYSHNSQGATHPVGQKQVNSWGLHDMQGNVWEWTFDGFDPHFYQKCPPPCVDPVNLGTGADKVIRGGSYSSSAQGIRVTNRDAYAPRQFGANIGFRLIRILAR
jgi:formylglycine-generating enzyme required for sulfatase activity